MKTLKRISNFLTIIVFACVIGGVAVVAPMIRGYHPVVVLSGSMEPAYHVGSIIYYKEASFERINVGDPITFVSGEGGAMVTHRVVEKDESARVFYTKGDANNDRDPGTVSYANVAGKASDITIPYGGYFVNYVKRPYVIVIMAAILLAGTMVDHLAGGKDKERQKT